MLQTVSRCNEFPKSASLNTYSTSSYFSLIPVIVGSFGFNILAFISAISRFYACLAKIESFSFSLRYSRILSLFLAPQFLISDILAYFLSFLAYLLFPRPPFALLFFFLFIFLFFDRILHIFSHSSGFYLPHFESSTYSSSLVKTSSTSNPSSSSTWSLNWV